MVRRILVLGLGPAGAASAIFLAGAGHAVTAVDKGKRHRLRVGESLPPDAAQVLKDLGLWEAFSAAGHAPCYGNQSIWGSPDLHYSDFITHPQGHGWHLDRFAFEEMLVAKAAGMGVQVIRPAVLRGAERDAGKWRVEWEGEGVEQHGKSFDFVVDATGRNSWFARRQGVERLYEDQQLALVAFLEQQRKESYTASLIEAVEEGWWYSAPLPNDRMVTAFMCVPDFQQRAHWRTEGGWWELIQTAPHTFSRLQETQSLWLETPKFVSADSGILERIHGERWLAVGDAALTYDPISSHGIQMAMVGAREAAKAINADLSGDAQALRKHEQLMFDAYRSYHAQRQKFYQSEGRFPDAAYWQARKGLVKG